MKLYDMQDEEQKKIQRSKKKENSSIDHLDQNEKIEKKIEFFFLST
jgi:hypothetical protein